MIIGTGMIALVEETLKSDNSDGSKSDIVIDPRVLNNYCYGILVITMVTTTAMTRTATKCEGSFRKLVALKNRALCLCGVANYVTLCQGRRQDFWFGGLILAEV